MSRLVLIDPNTLIGREIAAEIARAGFHWEVPALFHTSDDDEHQITQIAGQGALVPPLDDIDDVGDCEVVILASEDETARLEIVDRILEARPDALFIDATRWRRYQHLTEPAMDADGLSSGNRLHLAHPAVVIAATVLDAVRAYEPERLSLFAIDPVSVSGKSAVEILARQAAQRLQGGSVEEALDGGVLAFNLVSMSGARLTEEACRLLPDVDVAATEAKAGIFHGHLAHLGLVFRHPVEYDEISDQIGLYPGITIAQPPLNLDAVPDRDDILIAEPSISPDRRTVALNAMVDGTRVGGALTVVSILRGLT